MKRQTTVIFPRTRPYFAQLQEDVVDDDKENLLYFEAPSMRKLHEIMSHWQIDNRKRLLSTSVQQDGTMFCCIALTNPTENTIVGRNGNKAGVTSGGQLWVSQVAYD